MQIKLKINPEFQNLIPPLSGDEFGQLEQNILQNGCRDAIITWHSTIVDGHNRYAICTKHNILFKTTGMRFKSENDAILWILENQLGRRNLSDASRIELAMRKVELLRRHKSGSFIKRKLIAENAGVSEQNVRKYMQIKKTADPKLIARLQKGDVKIGTAHSGLTVQTKTIRKLCSAEDLREFNLKFNYSKIVSENIGRIKKLYTFSFENISDDSSSENLELIKKRIAAQLKALDKIFCALNGSLPV